MDAKADFRRRDRGADRSQHLPAMHRVEQPCQIEEAGLIGALIAGLGAAIIGYYFKE